MSERPPQAAGAASTLSSTFAGAASDSNVASAPAAAPARRRSRRVKPDAVAPTVDDPRCPPRDRLICALITHLFTAGNVGFGGCVDLPARALASPAFAAERKVGSPITMQIHALKTGTVRVKRAFLFPSAGPRRQLDLFLPGPWSEPLPIHCWAIEHDGRVLLVDTRRDRDGPQHSLRPLRSAPASRSFRRRSRPPACRSTTSPRSC